MDTGTIEFAGLDGGPVRVSGAALEGLRSSIQGGVVRRGDSGWTDATLIWNAMARAEPTLIVQPASAEDVATTVAFAREHGLLLSVRGGGHHIAGLSIAPDGLTLDMSRMRDVRVDPDARLVHVGAGCTLGEVDRATQQHGLATVLGLVSEVGVAGLTLGGGFGYLMRRFGWAVDNLEEVEIVTADGVVRIANRGSDADLFWAVRGGGGNFGVVTRFTFRLHEVGPLITGGLMLWSADRADEVLATYRAVTERGPRELTLIAVIRQAPPAPFVPELWHGKMVVGVMVCHTGADPDGDLASLRALGNPVVDIVTRKPYTEQQMMLDAAEPKGLNYYWKAEYASQLSDEFLRTFRDGALRVTSPLAESILIHIGGAANERAPDDGAVGNRDARYVVGIAGTWTPEMQGEPHIAWVRQSWQDVLPFTTGGSYVNFHLPEDGVERTRSAYGRNYDRLRRIKARYDPANLFRRNRNIEPAAREAPAHVATAR